MSKRFSRLKVLEHELNRFHGYRDFSFVVRKDANSKKLSVCLRGMWETDKSEETCYRVNAKMLASYSRSCKDQRDRQFIGCSARDAVDFLEAESR